MKLAALLVAAACAWSLGAHAAGATPDSETAGPSGLRLSKPGAAVTASIRVVGAVAQPGTVVVSPLAATVDAVVAASGGALPQAYEFATLVLRQRADDVSGAAPAGADCRSLSDVQTLLLLRDDAMLSSEKTLAAGVRDGTMHRVGVPRLVRGAADVPGLPPLLDGDVVAVPLRTALVYVSASDGSITRLQHESSATADEYLQLADPEGRDDADRHVMLYPDGRLVSLSLAPWRYRPTMVPPGSLIAPAVDCLRTE